jgi:hypothetical protein
MLRNVVLILGVAVSAFGATYTVTPIPSPSGLTVNSMVGINNSGQVTGSGNAGATTHAFIASPSGSVAMPLISGWISMIGTAINASGQVAGYGNNGSTTLPFIGTTAGSTAIPLPSGWTSAEGNAINASGQVAGSGTTEQAFIGTLSGSTVIPLPTGWVGAVGYAVNASGQVTGYGVNGTVSQAYIGTTAGSTAIPLLSGWTSMQGTAINDSGQIAGFGNNGSGNQAFVATTSGATPIPLPAGATSASASAQSINNGGTVVGGSTAGGWIWDSINGIRLLNASAPSGWNVSSALSISNSGLILAQASQNGGALQYVELTPGGTVSSTPAPSTAALLLLGASMCWMWFRWRASRT